MFKTWLLAARPKTLSASIAPALVGASFAYSWDLFLLLCTMGSAMFIQIGTNLMNDALDCKKGADTPSRIGPTRVTSSGLLSVAQVMGGGFLSFALSLVIGIPLIMKGGILILVLLLLSCLLGYLYTGGPLPMAYNGLGEIFSFLFFGVVLTVVSCYLQTGTLPATAIIAGCQMGLLSTVMLAINNLRDIAEDSTTHKKTLAVRFGAHFAKIEIGLLTLLPFILNVLWQPFSFNWLLFPLALHLVNHVWKTIPGPRYNSFLAMGGMLQLAFGLLTVIANKFGGGNAILLRLGFF